MNSTLRKFGPALAGIVLGAAALAGCGKQEALDAPKLDSGGADYSVYVAMGTNISAGWQSGGLVDRHQTHSFPALFAKQVGAANFDMPLVNADGLPALSRLIQIGPPLLISNSGRVQGSGTNTALATAYHNLGVPFAILPDAADTSLYYTTTPARTQMFDLIQRHRGSLLNQVLEQINPPPTFISFEYGLNELLGPASAGNGTPAIPAALWANYLGYTLGVLKLSLPNVKCALFTVPDVTTTPFVTTIPPLVLGANGQPVVPFVPILGIDGGVTRPLIYGQDFVLLTAGALLAGGTGYPVGYNSYLSGNPVPGNGNPLPDAVVLSASEVTSLRAATQAYNAAVRQQAATYHWAVVDLAALLKTAATTGIHVQGTNYTSAFLSGGLFSLDGVHPNDLADGIICNVMIEAVNATYGSNVALVDLSEAQTASADDALPARGESPMSPALVDAAERFADGQVRGAVSFPWRAAPAGRSATRR